MKKLLVVLMAVSVFASGCSLLQGSEKDRFVDATIEATCLIFQSDNIFDPTLEDQAKEIYTNHGFDADDEDAMLALTEKYQEDPDVEAKITAGLEGCAGDILGGLTDAMEDVEIDMEVLEDEVMEEEEVVAEEEEVMEEEEEVVEEEEEVVVEEEAVVEEEPVVEEATE
ncbi:hypothetical protein HN709_00915 [Candidatus Peregrinibacteria bacterium]|jgi:hypothetical protein|nr:hypothetical protein [Candidatus Peregrinibacteria bacterium]MBT7736226.1 hypothetical protein [Candidatus Peregrinibacteria bacterium]